MKSDYAIIKGKPIGHAVNCCVCGKQFVKKSSSQAFCSNGRNKGAGNCKDAFWNKVDPEKRCRKTPYYYNNIHRETDIDEGPEGWDGHKDY